MFKLKSIIAGLTVLSLSLGLAGGIKPAEAVQLDDGVGKKEPVNIYLHGFDGDAESTAQLSSVISGVDVREKEKLGWDFKNEPERIKTLYKSVFYYPAGQEDAYYFSSFKGVKGFKVIRPLNDLNNIGSKSKGIQLVFVNNRQYINRQMEYLRYVVRDVVDKGRQVNIIGHSMGGLLAVAYAHKYANDKTSTGLNKISKIVTIAAPLNGASSKSWLKVFKDTPKKWVLDSLEDLNPSSSFIKNLYNDKRVLNKDIEVYSIWGSSDWVVQRSSALALESYAKKDGFKYKQKVFSGEGHRSIMKDKTALKSVKNFLER